MRTFFKSALWFRCNFYKYTTTYFATDVCYLCAIYFGCNPLSPSIFLGLFVLIVSDEAASAIRRESTPLLKKKRKKSDPLRLQKKKSHPQWRNCDFVFGRFRWIWNRELSKVWLLKWNMIDHDDHSLMTKKIQWKTWSRKQAALNFTMLYRFSILPRSRALKRKLNYYHKLCTVAVVTLRVNVKFVDVVLVHVFLIKRWTDSDMCT